jgi:RimJ/RimL family protein N-acetyltransferase
LVVNTSLQLVPFEPRFLPAVLPWFDHPEVQHRLGGRAWPERELALRVARADEEFRGRLVLRTHTFVALNEHGRPVAQIGGDVYDRWTIWDAATDQVTAEIPFRSMGSAYVVDPGRWGCGYGRATLRALVDASETADVEQFVLGIDADNTASMRAAAAAGFVPLTREPDAEGIVYMHALR